MICQDVNVEGLEAYVTSTLGAESTMVKLTLKNGRFSSQVLRERAVVASTSWKST
ncbi:MAG: hypothetical protein IPH22_04790 [Nitrosomonas sp.]|nr:hypothetical protein [Nitrosomonas sp.]